MPHVLWGLPYSSAARARWYWRAAGAFAAGRLPPGVVLLCAGE